MGVRVRGREAVALAGSVAIAASATVAGLAAAGWAAVVAVDLIPRDAVGDWYVLVYIAVILLMTAGGTVGLFLGYRIHFRMRRLLSR